MVMVQVVVMIHHTGLLGKLRARQLLNQSSHIVTWMIWTAQLQCLQQHCELSVVEPVQLFGLSTSPVHPQLLSSPWRYRFQDQHIWFPAQRETPDGY
jgi:hypothetical protein